MKDMLNIIYEALCLNEYIRSMTYNENTEQYRIKFYEQPETADKTGPMITILVLQIQTKRTTEVTKNFL